MQMDNVRKPISSNMSTNHSSSQILVRRNKEISQKQLLVLNQRYIQNTTQPPHSGQDSNKLRQIDVARNMYALLEQQNPGSQQHFKQKILQKGRNPFGASRNSNISQLSQQNSQGSVYISSYQ